MIRLLALVLLFLLSSSPTPGSGQERTGQWLRELTLAEKTSLLTGKNSWETVDIPRLGIPSVWMTDGPAGLIKRIAAEDGTERSVPATTFPSAGALAATWNPELIEMVGEVIGEEAAHNGVSLLLAPGLNLKRHPLGGRNFEYYSEDPLLSGKIAAAFVRGVQSRGVGATLKHFAVNNQEHRRMVIDARVGDRALRELYLRGFEIAVRESDPVAVMTAYNRVNGVPASSNPLLLTKILREEWGFDGIVVSDWGAVNDPVGAIQAGLDLEMPANPLTPPILEAAVREERLPLEDLDRAVGNVLGLVTLHERLPRHENPEGPHQGHAVAETAALESIVLLENKGALPLDPSHHPRLGVVGRLAVHPRIQGIGSSQMSPTQVDTIWTSLRELGLERGFDVQGWFPEYSEDGLTSGEEGMPDEHTCGCKHDCLPRWHRWGAGPFGAIPPR
ncbi:MAG: glycoside hydrolase family 3 protein [Gemmatimonadota bacterium]